MTTGKQTLTRLGLACLIGLLFLLPDGARIWRLGSLRDYTPFSVRTASTMVWDETFMYAAEVNYSYQHHRLAYDTDAYEHRNEPVPYSVLPVELEVVLASIFHSVAAAQLFCHLFFPGLSAWLLMGLFMRFNASAWMSAFLALLSLIVSFSPSVFSYSTPYILRLGLHAPLINTLDASRNPHPNMSFPLFLGALLVLGAALRKRSAGYALGAGVLGGLLFYTYIYYAIPWSMGAALLALFCLLFWTDRFPAALVSAGTTCAVGLPFIFWTRAAKKAGGYIYRSDRLGMTYSHLPSRSDLDYSLAFLGAVALVTIAWAVCRTTISGIAEETRRYADTIVPVFACAALGGIAGINLQVVTGFNVQAEKHYTHMVVQPALVVLTLVLLLAVSARFRARRAAGWAGVLFAGLYLMAAAVQVSAGLNTAEQHRVLRPDAELFDWLEHNSSPDDVVATTDLQISTALPVYTRDYTLLANGTRTSGSDDEVLDRFLLANALVSTPPNVVDQELRPPYAEPAYAPGHPVDYYYVPFLFEYSPYRVADLFKPMLTPQATSAALAKYQSLNANDASPQNLSRQLHRFRVNYIYALKGQTPAAIPGWRLERVLDTEKGTLWRLTPA